MFFYTFSLVVEPSLQKICFYDFLTPRCRWRSMDGSSKTWRCTAEVILPRCALGFESWTAVSRKRRRGVFVLLSLCWAFVKKPGFAIEFWVIFWLFSVGFFQKTYLFWAKNSGPFLSKSWRRKAGDRSKNSLSLGFSLKKEEDTHKNI